MKILTTTLLILNSLVLFSQEAVIGHYRDFFGSRLYLNADSTFKYTWNFDMLSSWTKGTWTIRQDTVYLNMVPLYDTVGVRKLDGSEHDSLILSTDESPERITQIQLAGTMLAGGGQNRQAYPEKLVFKKDRLYKLRNGRLETQKQKGIGSGRKWDPWYFKSDD
jgi:hypothetical protein